MMDVIFALRITASIVYNFIAGYVHHWLEMDESIMKMNRVAFSLSRGFRMALGHHLFTVYRFRMITITFDYLSYRYLLYKTKIVTILELGRKNNQNHYDIKLKDGITYFNCTDSITSEKAPIWNLQAQEVNNEDDYFYLMRRQHSSPIPKKF